MMKVDINRIKYFLTVGLFLKREHSSKRKNIAIRELRKFYLAVKFFLNATTQLLRQSFRSPRLWPSYL